MQPITSLLLVIKSRHEAAEALAHTMAHWLALRGVSARLEPSTPCAQILRQAACGVDAVVVLGGDGTLVGVARKLVDMALPILGINFGKVGFLTEVPPKQWERVLTRLLEGRVPVVERLALQWTLIRQNTHSPNASNQDHHCLAQNCQTKNDEQGHAINDIVVGRGPLARVLPLHVNVNGHNIGWVRSDGLIVSTPSGTTGYAMSAGASLVHPDVQAMVITSISPFLCRFPSMALPGSSRVELQVPKDIPEAFLTIDGQDGISLGGGDIIAVQGMTGGLRLLLPNTAGYFQRLLGCGFIQVAPKHKNETY